jgi:hypothetical protein
MTDHNAEMDALMQRLVTAGRIETFTDDDGDEPMRLMRDGKYWGIEAARAFHLRGERPGRGGRATRYVVGRSGP